MKSSKNKTLTIDNVKQEETTLIKSIILDHGQNYTERNIINSTINGDVLKIIKRLPEHFVDLLVVDPPYNLSKKYNDAKFNKASEKEYSEWFEKWVKEIPRIMKENGSLYFCGDWSSTPLYYPILEKYFVIQNRITWERDKGRGSKTNWKNNIEDIFFCTMKPSKYTFNIDQVKTKKIVIAPYRDAEGKPKDWFEENGKKYRFTAPSNIWTDITIPYWSMPENTEHPTQKPEKLIAKLVIASSNKDDFVLDLFCGSGTTPVVAKKLGRKYCGIEMDKGYCLLTAKRLLLADKDKRIQGYSNGIFLGRNEKGK